LSQIDINSGVTGDHTHDPAVLGDGGPVAHSDLIDFFNDDHTGYALLDGRSTPQKFNFGALSGASTGHVSSTSHGVKGKYFLNEAHTITVDDANVRIGIGVASPAETLDVVGDIQFSGSAVGGTVPLARMQVDEQSGSSTTAWTTTPTDLVTLASMNVIAGDRIDITALLDCTPAAGTTIVRSAIYQSAGTATGEWIISGGQASTTVINLMQLANPGLTTRLIATARTWLRITGTGTLTLSVRGTAVTASSTASRIDLNALVLRGL
jgi:hypothetical protein